jgi:preprotein translocase subunit SecG
MAILTAILNTLIIIVCVFMVCLILIQRGKGGGLAGAFGGVGGSSAFGTKSGDVFTRVTMVVATVWIILSMLLVVLYNQKAESAFDDGSNTSVSKELAPKSSKKSKAKDGAADSGTKDTGETPKAPTSTDIPALPVEPAPAKPK